jgi:hypothetical protein
MAAKYLAVVDGSKLNDVLRRDFAEWTNHRNGVFSLALFVCGGCGLWSPGG